MRRTINVPEFVSTFVPVQFLGGKLVRVWVRVMLLLCCFFEVWVAVFFWVVLVVMETMLHFDQEQLLLEAGWPGRVAS